MKKWIASLLVVVPTAWGADLKSLYDAHQWFELREAMRTQEGPRLYRVAVAAAFNDAKRADDEFRALLRSATEADAAEIREAADWIIALYGRRGQYRHVIPGAKLAGLGRLPTLAVTARGPSRIRGEISVDGHLVAPLSINGRPTRLVLDSGANISVITESEARRLGLSAVPGQTPFTWFAGNETRQRLAVAKRLEIGNFRFRNVSFGVIADADLAKFSTEIRGAVGLPVLMAMETFRWNRNGDLEFGFPSNVAGEGNLCFNVWGFAVRFDFQQRKVYAALDTGNPGTIWWPALSRDFPSVLESVPGEKTLEVSGGSPAEVKPAVVPRLTIQVGGLQVVHNDAPINRAQTSADSAYYAGNLGLDLLTQGQRFTIDFKALVLKLE